MRRALLVAAASFPVTALAITAATGQVIETTNFNATTGVSYVNQAHCSGAAALQLEWTISPVTGTEIFAADDVFKIFASNTAPTASGTGGTFCAETGDNQSLHAGPVGSTAATTALATTTVSAADVATNTNVKCDQSNEKTNVFVCAHWYNSGGTVRKGSATGTFQIQVVAPSAPTGVTVQEGDERLRVSWTANGTTPTTTDHYVAQAFLAGGTEVVATATSNGTSASISGLTNGTRYDVNVIAVSLGGNPSEPSAKVLDKAPIPAADFWDVYRDRGGVEGGGCTSGSAGALALLGAATLVALRRRKP